MAQQGYTRFVITLPPGMAKQIEETRRREGRNRSEFFREAVRLYLAARSGAGKGLSFVMPTEEDERRLVDPFLTFTEWETEADAAYDVLR